MAPPTARRPSPPPPPTVCQTPLPERAFTPGWRTYPVDCAAKAALATALVDIPVAILAVPVTSGPLPWLGILAGSIALVGKPVYNFFLRRVPADVVLPPLTDAFGYVLSATPAEYADAPEHTRAAESPRVSPRRDPHRLE